MKCTIDEFKKLVDGRAKRDYTIECLLKQNPGDYILIDGPSGAGKSILAFQMGLAVATGTDWMGFHTTPTKSLYLGFEGTYEERYKASLCFPHTTTNFKLETVSDTGLSFDSYKDLPLLFGDAKFIIVDCLRYVCADYCQPKVATYFIREFRSALRAIGATGALMHHLRKPSEFSDNEGNDSKGATDFRDCAVTHIGLSGKPANELSFHKIRDGKMRPPLSIKLNESKFIFECDNYGKKIPTGHKVRKTEICDFASEFEEKVRVQPPSAGVGASCASYVLRVDGSGSNGTDGRIASTKSGSCVPKPKTKQSAGAKSKNGNRMVDGVADRASIDPEDHSYLVKKCRVVQ